MNRISLLSSLISIGRGWAKRHGRIRALGTPGSVAGAAMDNVGLAAHRSEAACPTCSPTSAPFPETPSSRWGRRELSYLDNGFEYNLVLVAGAFAVSAIGAGGWSLDDALGLDLNGAWWASGALAAGLVGAALILAAARLGGREETPVAS
jgi:hypothetical protein